MKLLESLSALRRVTAQQAAISRDALAAADGATQDVHSERGEDEELSPPKSAASPPRSVKEQEEGLMHATLADVNDDEEALLRLGDAIAGHQDPVSGHGGARHATSAVFGRTLSVVKRKTHLLHEVAVRRAAIEANHSRRDELLTQVLAGEVGAPVELVGLHKFIAAHTHRGGNPSEANKSDFETFAATFGLPSKHRAIVSLRHLCDEVLNWWVDETLRQAEDESSSFESVRRVMAVAISTGASRDHPKLIRGIKIMEGRFADKVLADAREASESDAWRAKRTEETTGMPPVGQAEAAARGIRLAIKSAVAQRVPASHRSLVQAKAIIKELEQKESERGFLVARLKRRAAARQQT